jgi:hypothetical protein
MTTARFHRTSHNKKLSPVGRTTIAAAAAAGHAFRYRPKARAPFCSSTYVSIAATCSDAECPFKRGPDGAPGGCFVEAEHFTRKAMAQLDAAGASAQNAIADEVEAIDSAWCRDGVPQDGARGGRDLRIHVGGDTPDETAARALAGAAARWRARGGGSVWTYTHSWRRIPRAAFGAIAVLASCETHWQVASARRRGYAPALVVERFPDGKRPFMVAGTRFIPCPAESLNKTCVECRLCLDVDLHTKGLGIAFQVHGADASAATRPLVPLRAGRAA